MRVGVGPAFGTSGSQSNGEGVPHLPLLWPADLHLLAYFLWLVDFLVLSKNANIQARVTALAAVGESRLKETDGLWYRDPNPRDWENVRLQND